MSKKELLVIFDGDDTLWKTQELYDSAKMNFDRLMVKQGFSNTIEQLDNLDALRASMLLFAKTRFLESMLITYALLCGHHRKEWDIKVEHEIRQLGLMVFTIPPKLFDDTLSTLKLLSQHANLVLLTNGDQEIQKAKIKSLGRRFRTFFSSVHIVAAKTNEDYAAILSEFSSLPNKTWVVGNSIRSDINPATMSGMRSILIPRGTWKYEESKCLSSPCIIADSLMAVARIILRKE